MLTSTGFFSKDNQRGDMPDSWAGKKTSGDAVMLCQIYAVDHATGQLAARTLPGQKMATVTDGIEMVQLNVDPGDGQEQAKDNMRQYLYLMGKYGGKQQMLKASYEATHGPSPAVGVKNVYVYRPRKPMPWKTVYPVNATDGRTTKSFDNFALHHNISFEQLKVFWNFAVALAKKTSDRKPIVEMMMNLYGIERSRATNLAINFVTDVRVDNDAIVTLFNRVTWRGWNLVEGPASDLRHDDPGTRFDDFDISAMPESRQARIKAVKTLNATVEAITTAMRGGGMMINETEIDMSKASFGESYRALAESARTAMSAIRQYQDEDFIAFNPLMWIYKPRGREWRFELRRP
ncbi:hypothetical protein KY495_19325 [Massilia sp. PAMC28688]|uniref:hypothetical protein n=1 Tax=Massilia sp. PAMC28688 TaxID=2861283 RepID=UPI001C62C304|nr:hypothetical protein [Massilia sp. PAMC28688]QYF92845.1 hypothetical protein KY495_19325 [Massilia sp. PAMC28688]